MTRHDDRIRLRHMLDHGLDAPSGRGGYFGSRATATGAE